MPEHCHTLLRLPTGIWYSPGVKANVLFFEKRPASREVQTRKLWICDYRTNVDKTLRTKPLVHGDLDDFIRCYKERKETERFRCFRYEELIKRDKLNLDIFWLKEDRLANVENLPPPDVLAAEMVDNLEPRLNSSSASARDWPPKVRRFSGMTLLLAIPGTRCSAKRLRQRLAQGFAYSTVTDFAKFRG